MYFKHIFFISFLNKNYTNYLINKKSITQKLYYTYLLEKQSFS